MSATSSPLERAVFNFFSLFDFNKRKATIVSLEPALNDHFVCNTRCFIERKKRQSLYMSQVAHRAGAYPGFCSMKRLCLAPDGMLVHLRVTPCTIGRRYPFIHLGGETDSESKVAGLRTQHNVPGQGRSIRSREH